MTIKSIVRRTWLAALSLAVFCAVSRAQNAGQLSGTPIGSPSVDYSTGAVSSTANTPACAFDGDFNTFYASFDRSNTWVGLDLGRPHVITRVGWCPRSGHSGRVELALFEGSNREDFLDAVPLYLIAEPGRERTMTYADVSVSRGFRYVRYVGPNNVRCNIGELAFFGYEGAGDDSRFYQITNLPTLSIHTCSGADITSKVVEQESNITITYDGGRRIQEYPILARGRGNASWNFPKKPYRIKFNDGRSHRMLEGSPLESPAKAKKWTLINNYGDKTLMRNIVAFEMSRRLGMPYTPYCQPVDVVLNGEYRGCYQLCDQITVDRNRVNITEMEIEDNEEPELTGGYLIEVDAYANLEKSKFTSTRGIPVTIKSPDEDDITAAQKNYIRKHFNLMETSLWKVKYTDEATGYRSMLDVESFLRHFLVGEFSGNTDTYWSTYMYKNRGEDRFTVAPCWDFDLAFNNDNRIYPVNGRNDWVYRSGGSAANGMPAFVSRVLSDPYAATRMKEIWKRMRDSRQFSATSLVAFVDSLTDVLDASQALNFKRWPILNSLVHQNVEAKGSYRGEVDVLRDYIPSRIEWIDGHLGYSDKKEYVDSTFYISTPEDFIEFATAVNSGANGSTGYLTGDIDMKYYTVEFSPIGSAKSPFKGKFDGRGHRILNLSISGAGGLGVFGVVTGGADISNFILDASSSVSGSSYLGIVGMSSGSGNVTLSRLGNEAPITGTGKNVGGILGCNMGSSARFTITDCYNTGAITAARGESAAIAGWAGTNATVRNCWNCAEVTGMENTCGLARGTVKLTNCYSTVGTQGTAISMTAAGSGELCYNLNEGSGTDNMVWYQTIGEDPHPVFDVKHGVVHYDALAGQYYNTRVLMGDVNGDDRLSEEDIMAMADYLNGGRPEPFRAELADANNDGRIDVADIVAVRAAMTGAAPGGARPTASLYSSTASVKAASLRRTTVWINSSAPVTAYQADVTLSDGLYFRASDFAPGTLHDGSHRMTVTPLAAVSEGSDSLTSVRVLVYSTTNAPLSAITGTAFTFMMHSDSTFAGGTLQLSGMTLSSVKAVGVSAADVGYDIFLGKTYVSDIIMEPEMAYLEIGDTMRIRSTIIPALATNKTLNWISEDESTATVSADGLITGVAPGETRVYAVAADGSNVRAGISVAVVDDISAIAGIKGGVLGKDEDIYDLWGRKVGTGSTQGLKPGIYIINGRKVYVH